MTSMTWSSAQKALSTPAETRPAPRAWTQAVSLYNEINEVLVETLGSIGIELTATNRGTDVMQDALSRGIGLKR